MRILIPIVIGLLAVSCASTPTMKGVAGTYERKDKDGDTFRVVLLENGIVEDYKNGKKEEKEWKWEISKEGELYFIYEDVNIGVYRINKDGSITVIADILHGKRTDIPKEYQFTLKKIK